MSALPDDVELLRADFGSIALARQAVSQVNLATSRYRGQIDDNSLRVFLGDPSHYLLMAVNGETVAGSLYGYALRQPYRADPEFLLYGIDVRPMYQGRGIGKALVRQFVSDARAANAYEVWVLTDRDNAAAVRMYLASGFTSSHACTLLMSADLETAAAR